MVPMPLSPVFAGSRRARALRSIKTTVTGLQSADPLVGGWEGQNPYTKPAKGGGGGCTVM